MGKQVKGSVILLITALIWGTAFVAQSVGMESIDALTFNCLRSFLGALFLVPVLFFTGKSLKIEKVLLMRGLILGFVFTIASGFQQFAFYDSTSGKIAFITALYIFFVPVFGLFTHKKPHILTFACAALALAGTFLLCVRPGDNSGINKGDLMALCCAVFFALHIMLIDRFTSDTKDSTDGIRMSLIQFLVAGSLSGILMLIFEEPSPANISTAVLPLLYAGIMSSGVAYTLQIVGQKYASPFLASLLMCTESVFALAAGALLLREVPSARELIGAGIMFAAIVLSQVVEKLHGKQEEDTATCPASDKKSPAVCSAGNKAGGAGPKA